MKRRYTLLHILTAIFFTAVVCLFAGNIWRMAQESNVKINAYEAGKIAMVKAIEHEVPKGYVFWVDDLKFIPRKDGAVNVIAMGGKK